MFVKIYGCFLYEKAVMVFAVHKFDVIVYEFVHCPYN
jgi:hypothetical protein